MSVFSAASRMKLRLAGIANPPGGLYALNIEHRTSNVQHRISNIDGALRGVGATTPTSRRLRFIYFKTSESQNPPKADKSRRKVLYCTAFFNRQNTLFDVGRSFFSNHLV